jgi:hypothetical protein
VSSWLHKARQVQLILDIPAQPATRMKDRRAALFSCFKDGSLLLDARDNQKPARFYLAPGDTFPWEAFFAKMLAAWQLCDYTDVPNQFKPLKRIPQFVIDGFPAEPLENKFKILATLRKQGYFSALSARK